MIGQPQHPIHYAFGIVSHAPSVLEAWVHERLAIKVQYHLLYLAFFFYVGYVFGGLQTAKDLAGIGIFSTFLMSLPAQLLNYKKYSLEVMSDCYFNAVLVFHGFFLTYFLVYNIVLLITSATGQWTLATGNALMALSATLMVGYSIQLAVTLNYKVRWFYVPLVSMGLGYGLYDVISKIPLPQ